MAIDRSARARRAAQSALFVAAAMLIGTGAAQATLTISKKATNNVTCAAGVCTATAKAAVLNASDLAAMLGGSDVRVVPAKKASDIDVAAQVAWGSAHKLTLDAYTSIAMEQPLLVQGTSGLTLTTNDGGTGGTLSFSGKGDVTFLDLTSSLVVNGGSYTLVGDVATLAAKIKADMSGNYALAAGYSAKNDGIYRKSPIAEFAGRFEGLGNTIDGLKIAIKSKAAHSPSGDPWAGEIGLFGTVDAGAVIENIGVTSAKVTGGDLMNVGLLAGSLSGTVVNAFSTGSATVGNGVAGGQVISPDVGGLIGAIFGGAVLSHSYSSATVTSGGSSGAGGLVGGAYNGGQITGSSAFGNVTAGGNILGGPSGSAAGGFIGIVSDVSGIVVLQNDSAAGNVVVGSGGGCGSGGFLGYIFGAGQIMLSTASGSASVGAGDSGTATYSYAGGFAAIQVPDSGSEVSTISQSYATGAASGAPVTLVGGFIGYQDGAIHDSYSTGAVLASGAGPGALGGFSGYVDALGGITSAYSTGSVQPVGGSWFGGLVGGDFGALASTYWDTSTSGIANLAQGAGNIANAPGVSGLTTAQFQSGLPAGFSATAWAESANINGGLPYLTALVPPGAR